LDEKAQHPQPRLLGQRSECGDGLTFIHISIILELLKWRIAHHGRTRQYPADGPAIGDDEL
jgi:hypothetical protein